MLYVNFVDQAVLLPLHKNNSSHTSTQLKKRRMLCLSARTVYFKNVSTCLIFWLHITYFVPSDKSLVCITKTIIKLHKETCILENIPLEEGK